MKNASRGKAFAAIGLLGAIVFMASPVAHATTFLCTAGNNPVAGSTVNGNLVVESHQVCELTGVTVTGSVVAEPDSDVGLFSSTVRGTLTVQTTSFSMYDGTIDGTAQFGIGTSQNVTPFNVVCGSQFNSSVTISGEDKESGFEFGLSTMDVCQPGLITVYPPGNIVRGSLTVIDNKIPVNVDFNTVRGSVTVNGNSAVDITGDAIAGRLSCSSNTPAPTGMGTDNVHGGETGQCQGF
jgi:hypothetical protein